MKKWTKHYIVLVIRGACFSVALYFVFRALATMCLACNFTMIDAQTIQICKQEEEAGRSGALGKQFVFQALAQAVISPLLGKVMDWAGVNTNSVLILGMLICLLRLIASKGLSFFSKCLWIFQFVFLFPTKTTKVDNL